MSDPISDAQLADHLEGLLGDAEAALVDAALAGDTGLASRHQALADLLAEPVELPAVDVPPGLLDWTLARLDEELEQALRAPAPVRDQELADHLEGLVAPQDAARLEAALAADPALAARRQALADLLAEPVELPVLTPPAGLDELVLARLEEEGLVQEHDLCDVPAALFDATMIRLESEGLVAPAAYGGGRVSRFPGVGFAWLAAAAAILLVGLLGLVVGRSLAPTPADALAALDRRLQDVEAQRLRGERESAARVDGLEQALAGERERMQALSEERDDLSQVAREGRRLQDELRASAAERGRLQRELEAGARRAETFQSQLDGLQARLEQGAETETQLAALHGELSRRDQALRALEQEHAQTQERLAQLELARPPGSAPADVALHVADSQGVDLWDFARGQWVQLAGSQPLPPGSLLRGHGGRSLVRVEGIDFPLDLRQGLYLITATGRLEPLPDASRGASSATVARRPSLGEGVRELIAALSSGNRTASSQAQATLSVLYQRLGDPSPDMIAYVQGGGVPNAEQGGPPSTPEGWELWWARVRDTLPR